MPRTTPVAPPLTTLIRAQDGLVTAEQLHSHGFSRHSFRRRLERGEWQRLLPGVALTNSGKPTRRQLLIAACAWAGPHAAVDGPCACAWYGLGGHSAPEQVHVVVPSTCGLRSRDFVVVRRSDRDIEIGGRGAVPYVDAATAVIVAARGARSSRDAITLFSRALQTELVTIPALVSARHGLGDKWCRRLDDALAVVGVGIRSPAEEDARRLIQSSRLLPEPLWNQWVDLGDGGSPICIDALWKEAAMGHEVNGKRYHAWGENFDAMQARHDRATPAGIVLLHNTPARLRKDGVKALAEMERTYLRYAGRGLPPNVTLIQPPAIAREAS